MQSTIKAKPAQKAGQSGKSRQGQMGVVTPKSSEEVVVPSLTGAHVWLLRAAVVIGGAAVMAVEILGSRILAPSFGTTLHVWSALITVTLAALAAGYAVGGRVADRKPGLGALMTVMACAAGTLLLSDISTRPALRVAYEAGMVSGTFMATTVLFSTNPLPARNALPDGCSRRSQSSEPGSERGESLRAFDRRLGRGKSRCLAAINLPT